jgi:hypothetical protein
MHGYDHGVAMHVINATVKTLHKLEDDLHLVRNTLIKRLTARMHNLCNSLMIYIFFASVFHIFATNVVFSPDPLSFSPASTFCFPTELALLGILILTNRA